MSKPRTSYNWWDGVPHLLDVLVMNDPFTRRVLISHDQSGSVQVMTRHIIVGVRIIADCVLLIVRGGR